MQPNEIQYNYQEGLPFERQLFREGQLPLESGVIPPERLEFPTGEVLLNAQRRVEKGASYTENGVEFLLIPAEEEGKERLTLYIPGWGGQIQSQLFRRDVLAHCARKPGTAFLIPNAPGVGGSQPLPNALSKGLAQKGSFINYGAYMLHALKKPLSDHGTHDFIGDSLGARIVIGMTAASQEPIQELCLIDPPGSVHQSGWDLLRNFVGIEGNHAKHYTQASEDHESVELQKTLDTPTGFLEKIIEFLRNGALGDQIRQIRALCHNALEGDLTQALPRVQDRLMLCSPAHSALNHWKTTEGILKRLAENSSRPSRIEHLVLPKSTHSFHAANPAVGAAIFHVASFPLPSATSYGGECS